MTTMVCPSCEAQYLARVQRCPDCDVELLSSEDEDEAADDGLVEGQADQMTYELDEWDSASRVLLDRLLLGEDVHHVWEGTTLVVRADQEVTVDRLVEQVEVSEQPTLDPDVDQLIYELDGWSEAKKMVLGHELTNDELAHGWDSDDNLVVLADDEDAVEAVIDRIDAANPESDTDPERTIDVDPAADAEEDADEEPGDDNGPTPQDVMSDLFVAADRLMHRPKGRDEAAAFSSAADGAAALKLPYGFAPAIWQDLLDRVASLSEALGADPVDEPTVRDAAKALRSHLREYV